MAVMGSMSCFFCENCLAWLLWNRFTWRCEYGIRKALAMNLPSANTFHAITLILASRGGTTSLTAPLPWLPLSASPFPRRAATGNDLNCLWRRGTFRHGASWHWWRSCSRVVALRAGPASWRLDIRRPRILQGDLQEKNLVQFLFNFQQNKLMYIRSSQIALITMHTHVWQNYQKFYAHTGTKCNNE